MAPNRNYRHSEAKQTNQRLQNIERDTGSAGVPYQRSGRSQQRGRRAGDDADEGCSRQAAAAGRLAHQRSGCSQAPGSSPIGVVEVSRPSKEYYSAHQIDAANGLPPRLSIYLLCKFDHESGRLPSTYVKNHFYLTKKT
jgi:hypothetical protein